VRRHRRVNTVVRVGLTIVILAAVAAVPSRGSAGSCADCTLYVRAATADPETADGLTPGTAFSTIEEAVLATNNPGEVICIGPGQYPEGNLAPPLDGIAGSPIEFRGDRSGTCTGDPAGDVALAPPPGSSDDFPTTGFLLLGRSHVVIEGFTISGYLDAAIQVRSAAVSGANSSDIAIRDVAASRNKGSGIEIFAEKSISIENCQTLGNEDFGVFVQACTEPMEMGPCRGAQSRPVDVLISHNRVGGNGRDGIFVNDASAGTVWDNVVFSNGGSLGSGISLLAASETLAANNLVYDNRGAGIVIGGLNAQSPDAAVFNNTVYANDGWGIRIGQDASGDDPSSRKALLLNNILSANGSGAVTISRQSSCGYVASFNLIDGPYGADTPFNAFDLNDGTAAPLFVDPAGPDGVLGSERMGGRFVDRSADDDFHLQQRSAGNAMNSSAVDAGSAFVDEIGVGGSTASDGQPDSDIVDLGYHYGIEADDPAPGIPPTPLLPVYVRKAGNDENDGLSPETAKGSIGKAAKMAQAGVTVIVGPGQYSESNIGPPLNAGRATFLAAAGGELTGDSPGVVLIDPSRVDSGDFKRGFIIREACDVVIDGFHIWKANDAGIQIRDGADGSIVRNNFVISNDSGILVRDSNDAIIINNLIYDNSGGGVTVDGDSPNAHIQNNTIFRNLNGNGIQIDARGARVEFNIVDGNEFNGINLGKGARSGYFARHNLLNDNREGNWGGLAERGTGSLAEVDPAFIDPAGEDGILGGGIFPGNTPYFLDDRFELAQEISGQLQNSRAVDNAPITAVKGNLQDGTTRTDGIADDGQLDLGFHYRARPPQVIYVDPVEGDDSNSGLLPEHAVATVAEALRRAADGTVVQLFEETYSEADLRPPSGVTIAGAGVETIIDAGGEPFVFDVRNPRVTIVDMAIRGATSAGIRNRADDLHVGNCRIHDNLGNAKGIFLISGDGAILFNNLIHDNDNAGVIVGGTDLAATRTTLAHNTIVRNGLFGISVGLNSERDSAKTAIVHNVIAENSAVGISISPFSIARSQVEFNCNADGYTGLSAPETDITDDPLLTTAGSIRREFFLANRRAGQAATSPCVDAGSVGVRDVGLQRGTTRSDRTRDSSMVDLGFHYDVETIDIDFEQVAAALRRDTLSGDCDDDGKVAITELILAVRIALELEDLDACPELDENGDGRISIGELITAVNQALDG
jgi:nitrous oxidase accessory protein NosD